MPNLNTLLLFTQRPVLLLLRNSTLHDLAGSQTTCTPCPALAMNKRPNPCHRASLNVRQLPHPIQRHPINIHVIRIVIRRLSSMRGPQLWCHEQMQQVSRFRRDFIIAIRGGSARLVMVAGYEESTERSAGCKNDPAFTSNYEPVELPC